MFETLKAKTQKTRAEPKGSIAFLVSDDLTVSGYTSIGKNPEVVAAANRIASLVASMTIHLMQNTDRGDIRVKNGLSRKIDINPYKYGTRQTFIQTIVKNLLIASNNPGNAIVFPVTSGEYIEDLIPIPPEQYSLIPDGAGYRVIYAGRHFAPDEVLHFVYNPSSTYPWKGEGIKVQLRQLVQSLSQADKTKRSFLSSKWKPSVVVKVDAMTEEFASEKGRKRLTEEFIKTGEEGEPWFIPADQIDIEQVKPLTLNDLAISDTVKLDKRSVAALFGVPPFVLGVESYNKDEWNNFISTVIMPIAQGIEQELTKKLLVSPDMYFKFNSRSLFAYDITQLAQVGDDQYIRGIMTGNEVRDWLGLSPLDGLDELIILENYIPRGMIGDQKKLIQGGEIGE